MIQFGVIFGICALIAIVGYIAGRKSQVKDFGTIAIYTDEEGKDYLVLELSKDMYELKHMKKVTVKVDNRN